MIYGIVALTAGFLLDLWLGDPGWLYHPVCAIGKLIGVLEKEDTKDISGNAFRGTLRRAFGSGSRLSVQFFGAVWNLICRLWDFSLGWRDFGNFYVLPDAGNKVSEK